MTVRPAAGRWWRGKSIRIHPERTLVMATTTALPAPRLIGADGLGALFEALVADGYRVIGPAVQDGAIVLRELSSAAELPSGWGVTLEPGGYRLRRRDDTAAFGHAAGPPAGDRDPGPGARPAGFTVRAAPFRRVHHRGELHRIRRDMLLRVHGRRAGNRRVRLRPGAHRTARRYQHRNRAPLPGRYRLAAGRRRPAPGAHRARRRRCPRAGAGRGRGGGEPDGPPDGIRRTAGADGRQP